MGSLQVQKFVYSWFMGLDNSLEIVVHYFLIDRWFVLVIGVGFP